jgi:ElaB/YqjD/DUF883 family membrane-anchored ribosome-binding protein
MQKVGKTFEGFWDMLTGRKPRQEQQKKEVKPAEAKPEGNSKKEAGTNKIAGPLKEMQKAGRILSDFWNTITGKKPQKRTEKAGDNAAPQRPDYRAKIPKKKRKNVFQKFMGEVQKTRENVGNIFRQKADPEKANQQSQELTKNVQAAVKMVQASMAEYTKSESWKDLDKMAQKGRETMKPMARNEYNPAYSGNTTTNNSSSNTVNVTVGDVVVNGANKTNSQVGEEVANTVGKHASFQMRNVGLSSGIQ